MFYHYQALTLTALFHVAENEQFKILHIIKTDKIDVLEAGLGIEAGLSVT